MSQENKTPKTLAMEIIAEREKAFKKENKERYLDGVKYLRECEKVVKYILEKTPALTIFKDRELDIYVTEYGYISISLRNIQPDETVKRIWSNMVLDMIDKYGEPKKDRSYDDNVKYIWEITQNKQRLTIAMVTTPEINGCQLIKKVVMVPEQIKTIPAHEETQYEVVCK